MKDAELKTILQDKTTIDEKIKLIQELYKPKRRTDQDIFNIIEMFSPLNQMYAMFFKNKTQRESVKRMLNTLGEKKISKAIEYVVENRDKPYFPVITTPYELEAKYARLRELYKEHKHEENDLEYFRRKTAEFNKKHNLK